jgi:group I intron endonuclease
MIIYRAKNKINGKVYVGQTIENLTRRKSDHENSKNDYYFIRAIKKYGKENFEWKVLEHCDSKGEMNEMEFHYIKQYNSFGDNGYNLTFGGEGTIGFKHSNNTKQNLSVLAKKRFCSKESHPWYKRKHSDETRIKMSDSWKNRLPASDETRQKMSESQKKRDPSTRVLPEYKKGKEHHSYGKSLSDEHKKKLSKTFSGENNHFYGKKHSKVTRELMKKNHIDVSGVNNPMYGKKGAQCPNSKKYVITDPEGSSFVVKGLHNFCNNYEKIKLYSGSMVNCVKGRQAHHKGYKCRYYDDKLDSSLTIWSSA